MKIPPRPGMDLDLFIRPDSTVVLPVIPRFMHVLGVVVHNTALFPAHRHDEYELIVIETGNYECWVEQQRVRLGTGDMLLVRPGQTHEDELRPPLRYAGVA